MKNRVGGAAVMMFLGLVAAGADAAVTEHRSLTMPEGTVQYYVSLPNNYNPGRAYPLIISLPGMGVAKGTEESNQARNCTRRFLFDPTSMATNHIAMGVWYTGGLSAHGSDSAIKATMAVLEQVRKDQLIDPKRIFVLAFSAGGYTLDGLVWGGRYTPENFPFAGVIVCSCNGSAGGANAPRNMPVFLEYGAKGDMGSCVSGTKKRFDNLKAAGYTDVEIHAVAGQDHVISGFDANFKPNANQLIAEWWDRVNAAIVSGASSVPAVPDNTPPPRGEKNYAAPKMAKPPAIDGDLKDWAGVPGVKLTGSETPTGKLGGRDVYQDWETLGKETWEGDADFSATWYAAWDDAHFYLACLVKDDKHGNQKSGEEIWSSDSIQFRLDPANTKKDWGGSVYDYSYALADKPAVWRSGSGLAETSKYAIVRDSAAGTTTYEIAIPVENIPPASLAAGKVMGFSLIVNENDVSGWQGGWLGWGSRAIVYGKNASKLNDLTLSGPMAGK